MKKLLVVFLMLCLSLSAFAASDAKIGAAYGTITVDGVIDDAWAAAEQQDVALVDKGVIPSSTETTGKFRVMWDESYLYVLVEVDKAGKTVFTKAGGAEANNDCVDLCLTLDGNFNGVSIAGGAKYAGCFRVVEDGTKSGFGYIYDTNKDKNLGKMVVDGSKYVVEYAISWDDITPVAGHVVSLDIQINDNTNNNRTGLVTWAATPCYCWDKSTEHGTVTLLAKPAAPETAPAETAPATAPAETVPATAPAETAPATTPTTGGISVLALAGAAALLAGLASKKRK